MRTFGGITITLLAGLVLGAITHLSVVLAIPTLAGNSAFDRYAASLAPGETRLITDDSKDTPLPPFTDPAVAMAVCAFDLSEAPVRVEAPMPEGFASLSVHDRDGTALYSVTDRTAVAGVIGLLIMTRQQHDEALAADQGEGQTQELRFVSPRQRGLVLVRALAPYPSARPAIRESVAAMECFQETDE